MQGPYNTWVMWGAEAPGGRDYIHYPFPPGGFGYTFEERMKTWVKRWHAEALYTWMRQNGRFRRMFSKRMFIVFYGEYLSVQT